MKIRRNSFVYIFLLAVFYAFILFGCKKERSREYLLDKPLITNGTEHCYNKIRDGNETGLDCGGDCAPCTATVPTCNIADNMLNLNDKDETLTSPVCYYHPDTGYIYRGQMSLGTITLICRERPDITQTYNAVSSYYTLYGQVSIEIDATSNLDMRATLGEVFFSYENGEFVPTICNARFGKWDAWGNYISYKITYKIRCN